MWSTLTEGTCLAINSKGQSYPQYAEGNEINAYQSSAAKKNVVLVRRGKVNLVLALNRISLNLDDEIAF